MRGFAWLSFQSVAGRGSALIGQLALAWLLAPEDFGVIALAQTVVALVGALTGLGIESIVLQRHTTLRLWETATFRFSLGLGLVSMLGTLAAAPVAAAAYDAPEITLLIAISALSIPVYALSTVPAMKLRANLNFRFLAVAGTLELAATQVATVILALAGFGALSFVLPLPVLAVIKLIVFWRKAPALVSGAVRPFQYRYLASKGSSMLGSRLATEAVSQGAFIVMGLIASQAVVGAYFFAFRLAAQPLRMMAGNFTSVLFPVLAQLRNDPDRQLAAALRAARVLAYVTMPLCFLQAALMEPALRLLFAGRWDAAIFFGQVLSLGLPFDAVSWVAGALLMARAEFHRALVYSLILSPLFFVALWIGAGLGGPRGVVVGVSLFFITLAPVYASLVLSDGRNWASFVSTHFVVPALLSTVSFGFAYLMSFWLVDAGSHLIRCVLITTIGCSAFLLMVWWFSPQMVDEVRGQLKLDRFVTAFRRRPIRS